MGHQSSNLAAGVVQSMSQEMTSTCTASSGGNQKNVCNTTLYGCNNPIVLCENTITTSTSCDGNQVAQAAADAIQKLSNKAKAGLGFSEATTAAQIQQFMQQYIDSACADSSNWVQNQTSNLSCIRSNNAVINDIQKMDNKTQCQLNAVAAQLVQADQKIDNESDGFLSDLPEIFKQIAIIIAIIAAIGIALFLLLKLLRGGSSSSVKSSPPPPAALPKVASAPPPPAVSYPYYSVAPPIMYYQMPYAPPTAPTSTIKIPSGVANAVKAA